MRLVGTNIHYVPSNEVQVPTEEATGRGLKRILPLVVSFIVPVAAPWLAAKVGLSSALSGAISGVAGKAIGGIAGRAIASAVTGAALGAITGTGAGTGALLGLGGSLFSRPGATVTGSKVPGATTPMAAAPRPPSSKVGGVSLPTTPNQLPGVSPGVVGPGKVGPATGSGAPIVPGTTTSSSTGEYALNTPSPTPGAGPKPSPVSGPAEASLGQRAQTALGQAGSRVMKTLTDPDTILRAGMFLATGAISGSPEEQDLIKQQAQALRELRERDSQAFNMRMQLAQQAIGEANFYDPLAVANWAAAQAKTSASAAAQQAERQSVARGSRDKGRDAAIRRAGLFQTALGGSQAFVEGYGRGVDQKRAALTAAAGLIPSGGDFEYAALLGRERELAEQRANARAAGIGSLFAGLTEAPRWT